MHCNLYHLIGQLLKRICLLIPMCLLESIFHSHWQAAWCHGSLFVFVITRLHWCSCLFLLVSFKLVQAESKPATPCLCVQCRSVCARTNLTGKFPLRFPLGGTCVSNTLSREKWPSCQAFRGIHSNYSQQSWIQNETHLRRSIGRQIYVAFAFTRQRHLITATVQHQGERQCWLNTGKLRGECEQ